MNQAEIDQQQAVSDRTEPEELLSRESSPIEDTLARASAALPYLGARFGALPDGWRLSADLVHDPAAVRDLLDQVCQWYEMKDRQVAASFLVLGYFWYPMASAVACYLTERRLPALGAGNVAVHPRDGVAFLSPRCYVLPDDPAAYHPEAVVLDDEGALRARLVGQLEADHAAPLFATLRTVAPYSVTAMRANYLDRLASAVLWVSEELGKPDLARHEVPALVALANPRTRTGLLEVEEAGQRGVFLRRGGCCLNYRLSGKEKCDTCCLRPLDERLALLRRHVTRGTGS